MNDDQVTPRPSSEPPTDVRDLLGAFALDAVEDDERAAVEQHVLADQDSRAELHELQVGVGWLDRSSRRPSAETWDAIAREMAHDLAHASNVTPLRRRTSIATRTLGLAAAFVAAIAIAGGVRSALVAPADVGDAAFASAVSHARELPGTRAVTLATANDRGTIDAIVLESGAGIAVPKDLVSLDERRTYQLWAITEGGPVSLGTMGAEPTARAFRLPGGAATLAVTREPRGGSPQPTGVPVASDGLEIA